MRPPPPIHPFAGPLLDGANLYRLLHSQRVTTSAGVPTVWLGLLDYMRPKRLRLPALRLAVIGGSAAPRSLIQTLQDDYGVEVKHLWGARPGPSQIMSLASS